jgi:hypothetical protein
MADILAHLNHETYQATADKSVGPNCIVAWRYRKEGRFKGGGGHRHYSRTTVDSNSPALPSIMTGFDMVALSNVLMAHSFPRLEALLKGKTAPETSLSEINAALARLPHVPDENLC